MAHLLGAQALHLDYGTGAILTDVTVGLEDGDRIGVVGANGAGKSSLIRLLAGEADPHQGLVTRTTGVRVGTVSQRDDLADSDTVITSIVGDADEHQWASDPRIRDVLSGLTPDIPADALVATLSGGQRRRVALARLLVGEHDVLMLDEPTNHLDLDAVSWLAAHVRTRWAPGRGAVVVITHDRWFLDAVTTRTWEVHDGQVDIYEGGYAAYTLQRVERDRIASATEARRQNLLRKELAWLRRGAPARTSKPKFRIEAANALIADVPPVRDSVALSRLAAARLGKDVVDLIGCTVTYDGRDVVRDVNWSIGPGERVGLLGENGAGKTTVLRLITGELAPTSGRVKTGRTVRVAPLSQQLAELDDIADERISAVVSRFSSLTLADGQELTPGMLLERLGFTSAQLKLPVVRLSGGQRRRLQLLLVLLGAPNVLVLDEPTNDMDTDMLAAMEDLLDAWPGTMVVVSHDRYLLERITDHQYAVLDGGLRHLPGGVDEYLQLTARTRSARPGLGTFGPSDDAGEPGPGTDAPASVPSGAERRAVEKEMASLERRIERLHRKATDARAALADVDQSDYQRLAAEMAKITGWDREASDLEERWLELTEDLG